MILSTGHPLRAQLDAIYARIDRLKAQIKETETAPLTPAEHRECVREYLRGLHSPRHFFSSLQDPGFRRHAAHVRLEPEDAAMAAQVLLHGEDKVLDLLMAKVGSREPVGLPLAERPRRVEELRAEISRSWRESEIAARRLEVESGEADIVDRPGDADAAILLEVWGGESLPLLDAPEAEAA